MNKTIKKILTTTLLSATAISMIGCGTPNTKLAKNIDKGMAEFVNSLNNLDYVNPTSNDSKKLGKIVETSSNQNTITDEYLNKNLESINQTNTLTQPSTRTDNFNLFVLSEYPYISLTSNDNSATLSMQLTFSTDKINETSIDINAKINKLILKRSILMIYVNEIYNNRVTLSNDDRIAINAYVNVIKENTSFLNGNKGMVKNQLTLASDLMKNRSNNNLINYYMIKSGEALENRSNKIDSSISAIDSIIAIIEKNLNTSSIYYNANLSETYENAFENINNIKSNTSTTTENKSLGDNISSCLCFGDCNNENSSNLSQNNNSANNIKSQNQSISNELYNTNSKINNKNNSIDNITNNDQNNSYHTLNNSSDFKNRKTANYNNFNKNTLQNNLNNNNYLQNKPQTLEYTEDMKNYESNKNQSNTLQENKQRNNRRDIVKNQKSINHNNESTEKIKRVPYIRTLD